MRPSYALAVVLASSLIRSEEQSNNGHYLKLLENTSTYRGR